MNDKPTDSSFSIWAVREVDHLFSAFRRYTRFVLYSKWFLGLFAIILMASLIAWPLLSKDKSGMRVSFIGTSTKPGDAASPTMDNPEYKGTDDRGEKYDVVGTRAIQQTPELVIVENVFGKLFKPDGNINTIKAARAEFQQDNKIMDLYTDVTTTDVNSGYVFVTPHATVNTDTMDIDGEQQVTGDGPSGNLLAIGFKIRNNGNNIFFGSPGNRVNVHIDKMRADNAATK